MTQLIILSGKAHQVWQILSFLSSNYGNLNLGQITKADVGYLIKLQALEYALLWPGGQDNVSC